MLFSKKKFTGFLRTTLPTEEAISRLFNAIRSGIFGKARTKNNNKGINYKYVIIFVNVVYRLLLTRHWENSAEKPAPLLAAMVLFFGAYPPLNTH